MTLINPEKQGKAQAQRNVERMVADMLKEWGYEDGEIDACGEIVPSEELLARTAARDVAFCRHNWRCPGIYVWTCDHCKAKINLKNVDCGSGVGGHPAYNYRKDGFVYCIVCGVITESPEERR